MRPPTPVYVTSGMPRTRLCGKSWIWGALALLALGCAPQIGDDCDTSQDCSQGGERLCDVTQPDGYCTVFNCEPGSCPDNSVCVVFAVDESSVPECVDPNTLSRFTRSFCLRTCEGRSDCRSGYDCFDLRQPNDFSAVVVDSGPGRVCMPPKVAGKSLEGRSGAVCSTSSSTSTSTESD